MGPDIVADVDAANGVAQTGAYYIKVRFQTDRLPRYALRCRIAMLDEAACVLFPEPIPSVDLRVRFGQSLIPEVQSAACFLTGLRAVYHSRSNIEPVGELVDEKGSHRRAIGAKSRGRRELHAKIGAVALAQRRHAATNQRAIARPNVRYYFDRGHGRDLGCARDFCADRRNPFHTFHQSFEWRTRRNRQPSTCEPNTLIAVRQNGFHHSPSEAGFWLRASPAANPLAQAKHARQYQDNPSAESSITSTN